MADQPCSPDPLEKRFGSAVLAVGLAALRLECWNVRDLSGKTGHFPKQLGVAIQTLFWSSHMVLYLNPKDRETFNKGERRKQK